MSAVVKLVDGGYVSFLCPGCGRHHTLPVGDGFGTRWSFNGSLDKPTLTPSILATNGHYVSGYDGRGCWCDYNREHPDDVTFVCGICHSFVTDGQIQFLTDCTHKLAGQTVSLPELP